MKQWFTEQIALYLNKFNFNKIFLGIKSTSASIGSTFTVLYGYN